jgi:hypothetical protein
VLRALFLARARTYVRRCKHARMHGFPRCAALLRDGRECGRTVVQGSEFCVHHEQLVDQHGADELKRGLPRRKQARNSWQPTIVAASTHESTVREQSAVQRRSADPATVRPRLAEAAAESVEGIQRTLLDAATAASKPAWVEFECMDCGKRKRVEVPVPDVRARVAAIELLLREGLGRPPQVEEAPLPRLPTTAAEVEALSWDELKALVLAYPEAEYLPEQERKAWLMSRWVGLSQADRYAFRQALDAADANAAVQAGVSHNLTPI